MGLLVIGKDYHGIESLHFMDFSFISSEDVDVLFPTLDVRAYSMMLQSKHILKLTLKMAKQLDKKQN